MVNEIPQIVKNLMQDMLTNIDINHKDIMKNITQELINKGSELDLETLKMFWNYSEQNTKQYSFKELLIWVKSNIPLNIKKACVYKIVKENNRIQLHIVYLNENDEAVVNGDFPHKVVNTLSLDSELNEKFGNKNMIVLG